MKFVPVILVAVLSAAASAAFAQTKPSSVVLGAESVELTATVKAVIGEALMRSVCATAMKE